MAESSSARILSLSTCHFPLPRCSRFLARAFTRDPNRELAFRAVDDGAVRVCNALPQRNCGRFSRPSLLTGMKKNDDWRMGDTEQVLK
jgi:hypothetical protein